jgi:hypothetical protein
MEARSSNRYPRLHCKQTGRNVHARLLRLLIIRSHDTGKSQNEQTNDEAKSHGPSPVHENDL